MYICIYRYKHELHLAAERERSIERSKSQMELDWQVMNDLHYIDMYYLSYMCMIYIVHSLPNIVNLYLFM